MSKAKSTFQREVPYHLLLWVLLIGPHSYFNSSLIDKSGSIFLLNLGVKVGLLILITYINIYYLIPKFYQTKRYTSYIILLGVLFSLFIYANSQIEIYLSDSMTSLESFLFNFFNISRYTVISFLLYGLRGNFEQKEKLDQMHLEKLQSEINYLRAQINPHFLFNTLNNLYGLALEKSDRVPDVIIRLSKMMDYMLYELEGTKVPLKRDLENLENYIDLERIRQGNNAFIKYSVTGDVADQLVEPLLMLPLVENAFKHGVNQLITGAYLEIAVHVTDITLLFKVKNNYSAKCPEEKQIHSSIGLSNLQKRLELFYPMNHKLQITKTDNLYEVLLKIEFV